MTAAASDSDIVIAEAQLEQSKLALIDAEEILAKAALTAPFNGTITNVYVTEGEYANGDVIEIVSNDLKVVLSVDEIDIGKLAPSQPTIITLETWPDVEIAGEVGYIAPDASSSGSNGVVTYDVQINLEETELPILVGMTANARIIDSNLEDVLLVPNAAITANRKAGTYQVDLVTGESDGEPITEQVEVIVGLRDRDFTQIQIGLSDGDQVLIGELTAPTDSFGPGGGGPFGGN